MADLKFGLVLPHFGQHASIAEDRETALGHVNVKSLISAANKNSTWVKPAGGIFSTLGDIRGLILAGTPEDIVAGRTPIRPPAPTL